MRPNSSDPELARERALIIHPSIQIRCPAGNPWSWGDRSLDITYDQTQPSLDPFLVVFLISRPTAALPFLPLLFLLSPRQRWNGLADQGHEGLTVQPWLALGYSLVSRGGLVGWLASRPLVGWEEWRKDVWRGCGGMVVFGVSAVMVNHSLLPGVGRSRVVRVATYYSGNLDRLPRFGRAPSFVHIRSRARGRSSRSGEIGTSPPLIFLTPLLSREPSGRHVCAIVLGVTKPSMQVSPPSPRCRAIGLNGLEGGLTPHAMR